VTVQRIPINFATEREQWLALRRHDVTASAAGCLLGIHDYYTPYGLWLLKSGRVQEDPEETPAMRRGRFLESVAIEVLKEERPSWIINPPGIYLRDGDARLGATPDLFVNDPSAGFGVVQIKSVAPWIFKNNWLDRDTGEINVPLWIAVQAITEAHLAGASWAAVAALTVSNGIDLHLVPVPIHEGVVSRVRAAVAEFWKLVETGDRPDPDWKRDARLIEDLYEPTGEVISLEGDNELPALADERAALSRTIADAKDRQTEIKAIFLDRLNGAAQARIADGRVISAKRINRKGYEVAPSTYLDVRVSNRSASP
jgi:hypothetical protein